eukprot:1154746-Pelagomonas_calceolata.AAC.4
MMTCVQEGVPTRRAGRPCPPTCHSSGPAKGLFTAHDITSRYKDLLTSCSAIKATIPKIQPWSG